MKTESKHKPHVNIQPIVRNTRTVQEVKEEFTEYDKQLYKTPEIKQASKEAEKTRVIAKQ